MPGGEPHTRCSDSSAGPGLAAYKPAGALGDAQGVDAVAGAELGDGRGKVVANRRRGQEALAAKGRNAEILELFNTEIIGMPAEFVEPMKAMPMWPLMEAGAGTLVYDAQVMGGCQNGTGLDAELVAALSSTTVPVLVMDGGASPSPMRSGADAIAAHLPHAWRHTLDGQTHEADPAAVGAALEAYFAH